MRRSSTHRQICTTVSGNTEVIASGRPVRPSQHAIRTSRRPRLHSCDRTECRTSRPRSRRSIVEDRRAEMTGQAISARRSRAAELVPVDREDALRRGRTLHPVPRQRPCSSPVTSQRHQWRHPADRRCPARLTDRERHRRTVRRSPDGARPVGPARRRPRPAIGASTAPSRSSIDRWALPSAAPVNHLLTRSTTFPVMVRSATAASACSMLVQSSMRPIVGTSAPVATRSTRYRRSAATSPGVE